MAQNSGKKSITLNLKTKEGKDIFKRMVRDADVVVENFRPGVMDRLQVGYETLLKENHSLVQQFRFLLEGWGLVQINY